MIWAKFILFLMGRKNRQVLDEMMEVVCGTKKNYEMKAIDSRFLDLLTRRWYSGAK